MGDLVAQMENSLEELECQHRGQIQHLSTSLVEAIQKWGHDVYTVSTTKVEEVLMLEKKVLRLENEERVIEEKTSTS